MRWRALREKSQLGAMVTSVPALMLLLRELCVCDVARPCAVREGMGGWGVVNMWGGVCTNESAN